MNRGQFLDPKGRELAISLGFFWSSQTCRVRVLCIFSGSFHRPNKGSNLSITDLLSLWVSCVVRPPLWLIYAVIWLFDKMLFLHGITQQYTRTEEQSVWYAQRLWHEPSNDVWSLILFLQFLFSFLAVYLTVPQDQKLSLQVRNKMNHWFPLMWDNLLWLVQFTGLFRKVWIYSRYIHIQFRRH